jgi:hypothetical protein
MNKKNFKSPEKNKPLLPVPDRDEIARLELAKAEKNATSTKPELNAEQKEAYRKALRARNASKMDYRVGAQPLRAMPIPAYGARLKIWIYKLQLLIYTFNAQRLYKTYEIPAYSDKIGS